MSVVDEVTSPRPGLRASGLVTSSTTKRIRTLKRLLEGLYRSVLRQPINSLALVGGSDPDQSS